MTFHPNIQPDDRIAAMVPDFVRNAYFTYLESDKETYGGIEVMKFEIDKNLMLNQTANPDNRRYHTEISGTGNLRAAL